MGSTGCPVWNKVTISAVPIYNEELLKHLREGLPTLLEAIDDKDPTEFMRIYRTLGQSLSPY